jgi:hypothetical protein
MRIKSIIAFVTCVVFFSCTKENHVPVYPDMSGCRDTLFFFDEDILPIMNVNCNFSECHAQGGTGSYDFTKYSIVRSRAQAGTLEYRLMLPNDDPQHMPEHMKLSRCDENTIIAWIRQGYPEKP